MLLYPHFDINGQGHLTVGGLDTVSLAKEYGTTVEAIREANGLEDMPSPERMLLIPVP